MKKISIPTDNNYTVQ